MREGTGVALTVTLIERVGGLNGRLLDDIVD